MRNKKEEQSGGENSFYATPFWAVDRLADEVQMPIGGRWLAPGCGTGNIELAIHAHKDAKFRDVEWVCYEIDPILARIARERYAIAGMKATVIEEDFLKLDREPASGAIFDNAIFNPPNELAEAFIRTALCLSKMATVFQPQQFYASERRDEFFTVDCPPRLIRVLPNRCEFVNDKNGPMQVYSWYIFRREDLGRGADVDASTRRLALTPKDVRKSARSLLAEQQERHDRYKRGEINATAVAAAPAGRPLGELSATVGDAGINVARSVSVTLGPEGDCG